MWNLPNFGKKNLEKAIFGGKMPAIILIENAKFGRIMPNFG
jgi:hypothetical protein